jgi:hypothetical protein
MRVEENGSVGFTEKTIKKRIPPLHEPVAFYHFLVSESFLDRSSVTVASEMDT